MIDPKGSFIAVHADVPRMCVPAAAHTDPAALIEPLARLTEQSLGRQLERTGAPIVQENRQRTACQGEKRELRPGDGARAVPATEYGGYRAAAEPRQNVEHVDAVIDEPVAASSGTADRVVNGRERPEGGRALACEDLLDDETYRADRALADQPAGFHDRRQVPIRGAVAESDRVLPADMFHRQGVLQRMGH